MNKNDNNEGFETFLGAVKDLVEGVRDAVGASVFIADSDEPNPVTVQRNDSTGLGPDGATSAQRGQHGELAQRHDREREELEQRHARELEELDSRHDRESAEETSGQEAEVDRADRQADAAMRRADKQIERAERLAERARELAQRHHDIARKRAP